MLSNEFQTLGKIKWMSKNFPGLFSFDYSQLKDKNISIIMPSVFAKLHDSIL